jgi:Cornichon protein
MYIIPEAAVHGFLTSLFLINGYWVALLLNLPLLAFNIKKYVSPFYRQRFPDAAYYTGFPADGMVQDCRQCASSRCDRDFPKT